MSVLRRPRHVIAAAFAGCAVLRIAVELAAANGAGVFSVDFHVSPVIRCMEFFMGMMMAPAYIALKRAPERRPGGSASRPAGVTARMTVAELLVSSCYMFLMYRMEGIWIRGYFVLAACVLVFICALDSGAIGSLLSARAFTLFAVIQMEFYLFHQVIIRVLGPAMTVVSRSVFIQSVILFFITVAASALYDRLLKDKFTALALAALAFRRKTDGE
jgi:peptidoglycan/LPS O-acetylase OafA/YrhL